MNAILKKIYGKTPSQLLKEQGISLTEPVDIRKLAVNLGISVRRKSMELSGAMVQNLVLSAAVSQNDNLVIFYQAEHVSYEDICAIVAHEIAHCCLDGWDEIQHIELSRSYECNMACCKEVINAFARSLLIPEEALRAEAGKKPYPSLMELFNAFSAPLQMLKDRLDELNISYWKDM